MAARAGTLAFSFRGCQEDFLSEEKTTTEEESSEALDEESESLEPPPGPIRRTQPLEENPWLPFGAYAAFALSSVVLLPFCLQLAWELAVRPGFLPPWGLLAGGVLALLSCAGALLLGSDGSHGAAVDSYLLSTEILLRCLPKGRGRRRRRTILVLSFGIGAVAAWGSRCLWKAACLREYNTCRDICGSHVGGEAMRHLCEVNNMFGEVPGHPAYKYTQRGRTRDGDVEMCMGVLGVNHSQWGRQMLQHQWNYTAFEGVLMQSMNISVLEVYGPALGISWMFMMAAAQVARRGKMPELNVARRQYIEQRLSHKCRDYLWLFAHMYFLQGCRPDEIRGFYIVRKLRSIQRQRDALLAPYPREPSSPLTFRVRTCSADVPGPPQPRANGNAVHVDDEDEGDEYSGSASRQGTNNEDQVYAACWAAVYAAGYVLIPGLMRAAALEHSRERLVLYGFFSTREMAPMMMFGAVVIFITKAVVLFQFVRAYWFLERQLQMFVVFDSMWQFTDEDLQHTMEDADGSPLNAHASKFHKVLQEVDPNLCSDAHFVDEHGYRANFSRATLGDRAKLRQNLRLLDEWFCARRYLQIETYEWRILLDLAMVVIILTVLPPAIVVAWNFKVLSLKQSEVQSVNMIALWDMLFPFSFIFRYLMLTLGFNDAYARQIKEIETLKANVELAMSMRSGLREPTLNRAGWLETLPQEHADLIVAPEEVRFLAALLSHMEKLNSWALFLGIKVDARVVGSYASVAAVSIFTQVWPILRNVLGMGTSVPPTAVPR